MNNLSYPIAHFIKKNLTLVILLFHSILYSDHSTSILIFQYSILQFYDDSFSVKIGHPVHKRSILSISDWTFPVLVTCSSDVDTVSGVCALRGSDRATMGLRWGLHLANPEMFSTPFPNQDVDHPPTLEIQFESRSVYLKSLIYSSAKCTLSQGRGFLCFLKNITIHERRGWMRQLEQL